jgi:hypothetical protein
MAQGDVAYPPQQQNITVPSEDDSQRLQTVQGYVTHPPQQQNINLPIETDNCRSEIAQGHVAHPPSQQQRKRHRSPSIENVKVEEGEEEESKPIFRYPAYSISTE